MKTLFTYFFLLITIALNAQEQLTGVVLDENSIPLAGANIYIKGSYDGTISDGEGKFMLKPGKNENQILVVSFIGYQTYEKQIEPSDLKKELSVELKPLSNELNEVLITAGTFEAGDKKRAITLNSIDIATTASSDSDIYGALSTYPGAQKQGETGKIIVRGGDSYETNTYMDGMLVSSPYSSTMPDIPSRSRFSPFMFNGVMFSTGGYSAEYGQALSSVLELKTPGLFDEDITSISLMDVGLGVSHTVRNLRSAYSAEANYNNLTPYFLMAKHDLDWEEIPESYSGAIRHRIKVGKTGMIKSNASFNHSDSKLNYVGDLYDNALIGLQNNNLFYKTSYSTELNKKWMLKSGIAYNNDDDITEINEDKLSKKLTTIHSRIGLINYTNENLTLKFGGEFYNLNYTYSFKDISSDVEYLFGAKDNLFSGYFETDAKISKKLALRIGGRSEYSDYTNNFNVAPRLSLAYKTTKKSQVSMAYGTYYQQPQPDYLKYTNNVEFEKAEHYILNYQVAGDNRLFRTEFYHKNYDNLISYIPNEYEEPTQINNNGYGYATGIDIFWRDKKTLKNTEYWISYSFIDSKRKFKDYKKIVIPEFVSKHNLSAVYKRWEQSINSEVCFSYNFSTGRNYYNPYDENFSGGITKPIHDFSGNISYVTNLFGYMTIVHISVSNILGLEKTYAYRFVENSEVQGGYEAFPVNSMIQRTVIIGVFISLK